jgi:hypothetical protein
MIGHDAGQRIHLFTDSVDQLRARYPQLISLPNLVIIDPLDELSPVETMALMSKHKKLIISNSTFSSWAAWFSHSQAVVTPIPHHKNSWEDNLPKSWQRIDVQL